MRQNPNVHGLKTCSDPAFNPCVISYTFLHTTFKGTLTQVFFVSDVHVLISLYCSSVLISSKKCTSSQYERSL
jgi:hypothetical protein